MAVGNAFSLFLALPKDVETLVYHQKILSANHPWEVADKQKKLLVHVCHYCDLGTRGSQDGPSHVRQTTVELSSAVQRGQSQQGKVDDKLYEESTLPLQTSPCFSPPFCAPRMLAVIQSIGQGSNLYDEGGFCWWEKSDCNFL